jgi:hypothetical protein
VPLFTYVPSKSFAIYLTVAILYRLGVTFNPPSLALFATLLYGGMVGATFVALRQLLPAADRALAALAAAAVGACAVVMELNYLQPTGFVYLFGLGAYALTIRSLPARSGRVLFVISMVVAGGACFKMVALLYGAAIVVFLLTERSEAPGGRAPLEPLLGLAAGLTVAGSVPLASRDPARDQRAHFGCEGDPVSRWSQGVVERLDPDAITGEHQAPPGGVVEREGVHAPEALEEALDPPCLVPVDHDLAVGRRAESVTERHQLVPQLAEVVDLPVVRDPDGAVLVGHRLAARCGQVNDGEPAVAKHGPGVFVATRTIRPPRRLGLQHSLDRARVLGCHRPSAVEEPRDAAHRQ